MLYVIGGASRSGKTLLARRAVEELKMPYVPLDALFVSLARSRKDLGIEYNDKLLERPHKMWSFTKPFLDYFLEEEKEFLIEGDSIVPSQMYELLKEGKDIRCCFFGYTELVKEQKLDLIRKHHQGEIDWTKGMTDEEILPMIEEMIEFSKHLEQECDKFNIKYFDVSRDFETVRTEAFEYLFRN